jgi:hypothetical protein
MPTAGSAPVTKTPSGNPLPRRGQVKETIAKQIAAAAASVLVCDAGGGGGGKKLAGAKILPAPPGSAKKK